MFDVTKELKRIDDYFKNTPKDILIKEIEECMNSPETKRMEKALGCDKCIEENGEYHSCLIDPDGFKKWREKKNEK